VRALLSVVISGLAVLTLGCSGIFAQSFEDAFIPLCVGEHAPNAGDLNDVDYACACAKRAIERETEAPAERLAILADPDRMKLLLNDCDPDPSLNAEEDKAADAHFDEISKAAEEMAAEADAEAAKQGGGE